MLWKHVPTLLALLILHAPSVRASTCTALEPESIRLGDLTAREIREIQSVVDETGRELFVVGSAARGERRNIGKSLPFAKGSWGRSDID